MSIEGELRQKAAEIAARIQKRASGLKQEYLDLQKLTSEKKAQLDSVNLAGERLTNFKIKIGIDYQCPTCWIERGIQSSFFPVPSAGRNDVFKCQNGHDFTVTY